MRRSLPLLVVALVAAGSIVSATPGAEASTLPRAMAATGDSITRAFDVGWCCVLRDDPERSWSTGWNASVDSHYERLLSFDPAIAGHGYNDAVTGARMRDLATQLAAAASQRADYVTIEMGANDLCTSSPSSMTPTSTFASQFESALSAFVAARPRAQVFVASIPDIYQLWAVLHDNLMAETVWASFGICQSMLNPANSEADRQLVVSQEAADNEALRSVCANFTQCRWDGYAVYNTKFAGADVSTVDYFHPSAQGQSHLAAVTWNASYWPS